MKLDYSLETADERVAYINKVLENTPKEKLTAKYLSFMSDYMLFASDRNQTKKEKKEERPITTRNREVTISKRQVSFEEIVAGLENGEDGLYALIKDDKNQIMDYKDPVSEEDISKSPALQEQFRVLESLKKQFKTAGGPRKFSLKKQIIETWQEIYILKASLKNAPARGKVSNQVKTMAHMRLDENITLDENQMPQSDCIINLFKPECVSFLLCYYSQLKQECYDDFQSDMYCLLLDLENIAQDALMEKHEVLYDIMIWKIDGLTNEEIDKEVNAKYGENHSEQYYSILWRQRIPKLIAEEATRQWVMWYFTNKQRSYWKKCGRCGEIKLAHPLFYSRNTSKDGWYSICKECRSVKSPYNAKTQA